MRITFHQFKVFECVVHEKSITKAAKKMFLTQPAVSNIIKHLEELFETDLIKVIGKSVHLTTAGEKLIEACADVRHRMEKLEYELISLQSKNAGKLCITAVTTAKYFLPKLLGKFKKDFPKTKIELNVVNRTTAINRLKDNLDDFVIMSQPPKNKDLLVTSFFEDSLVVVGSAKEPVALIKNLKLDDLANQEWIIREKGSGTKIAVDNIFKNKNFTPNITMFVSNNECIKQLLIAGIGISIIPLQSIELELKMGKLTIIDVVDFPIQHKWYLVKNKFKQATPLVKTFLKYIENDDKINLNLVDFY